MKKKEAGVLPALSGKNGKGPKQQTKPEGDKPAAVYAVGFSMLNDKADGMEAVFKRNGEFVFWCKSASQHQHFKQRVKAGGKLEGFLISADTSQSQKTVASTHAALLEESWAVGCCPRTFARVHRFSEDGNQLLETHVFIPWALNCLQGGISPVVDRDDYAISRSKKIRHSPQKLIVCGC